MCSSAPLALALLLLVTWLDDAAAQNAEPWRATVISVEGKVEALRAGQTNWVPVSQNDTFERGDSIRVLEYSRAAILLPDNTEERLDQNTTVVFTPPEDDKGIWLRIIRGAVHIISREPAELEVLTPFANAGIEGTEFLVVVTDNETTITVFEGTVRVSNTAGEARVTSGQQVSARAGQQPLAQAVVRPRDAVQWTLYYAPVLGVEPLQPDEEPAPARANDPQFYSSRAAARLSVGRVDEARADIERALTADPMNVEARSLQSIIALTQNDKDEALRLANAAVATDPRSATALIALSYAQQASFDLSGSLGTLQRAVEQEPDNALAWARLSELWLAVGDVDQGLSAAQRASAIDPQLERTQTVLGYAYLTRIDIPRAIEAFDRAIALDQSAPLPRLGRGLALIRDGDLRRGRAEIEVAVILDPGNSLLRSYMGKAYYEEKRDELAESQLALAKELDPLDPTPWLYDAIRKQTVNRPVDALHDLEQSIEYNGNRAVYRSSLGVEEDLAVRSAGIAQIYRNLGFEHLALLEGAKSIHADPTSYSGHRLLADTYSTLPRHEIARVNELFQSQLLQPLNSTPIQPQLAETNLFILDTAGPAQIAFNEFGPAFNRDRFTFQGSAVGGANGTKGEDLVAAGIVDKWSVSFGQFHFETDGFRENNDLDQDVLNAFVQYRVSDKTSVLGELRSTEREQGDLRLLFDPTNFNPTERNTEAADSLRLGVRHSFTPTSQLIASLVHQEADIATDLPPVVSAAVDIDADTVEVQHVLRRDRWHVTGGVRFSDFARDETQTIFGLPTALQASIDSTSAYVYAQFQPSKTVSLTAGLSRDDLETTSFKRDEVNPKIGLIWEPNPRTTLRATAFKVLELPPITRQNVQPSLEPTNVVGFNQFYAENDAEGVTRYALSAERKLSSDAYVGVIFSRREHEIPFFAQNSSPPFDFFESEADLDEDLVEAYGYWTPTARLALSARYEDERFEGDPDFTPLGFISLDTRRVPLGFSYFHPSGLSAAVTATYVDQSGTFAPGPPLFVPLDDGDEFWVVDAAVSYRLPRRMGLLTFAVANLFDETFRYQDTDPLNPRILPESFATLKFTIAY